MGSSRTVGAGLIGFLADVQARGSAQALQALNLGGLAGRPIEEVFLGLADVVCPVGGSVDAGIAREAFVETIVGLTGAGITDLDSLSAAQLQTVFEMYVTRTIEMRVFNDIGSRGVVLPESVRAAQTVQNQLHDFIGRSVEDAASSMQSDLRGLAPSEVRDLVDRVYEAAFDFLESDGDAEGGAV